MAKGRRFGAIWLRAMSEEGRRRRWERRGVIDRPVGLFRLHFARAIMGKSAWRRETWLDVEIRM